MADVLIAGGGPAGLAAAIALAERGVSVSVFDPTGGVATPRAELLAHGAEAIVQRLGLGHVLSHSRQIENVASHWGAAGLQSHGTHPGLGFHGWGVDRRHLSRAMIARAEQVGVRIHKARVTATRKTADGWRVQTGTTCHSAKYVIDATGRPAGIARRHGARVLHGPDLVAVLWQTLRPHNSAMQAEAAPEGWWYRVPGSDSGTVAFVTSSDIAKQVNAYPLRHIAKAQDTLTLIDIENVQPRTRLMDCRSAVLDEASGPGWHATGDAAAAFDPISSQGLFNAMSGGFFAGNAAADALAGNAGAPQVYAALAARTAERTHAATHLQYAALPFDTPFWQHRARGGLEKAIKQAIPA